MKKIFITQPGLPPLDEYQELLKNIWSKKILTNNGPYHQEFEKKLCSFLGVKYISLFNNATIALIVAQKVLNFKNEIITTPFTFIATSHSIIWNNLSPVFADTDLEYGNLDINSVERLISKNTGGILAVHNYGLPGQVKELQSLSEKNNIPLIYDAAPAFGVEYNNDSILNYGDLSILSFHATKVFTTFEGGAIICKTKKIKDKIDLLRNFSILNECEVSSIGLNGKMNEAQSAMGIIQLKYFNDYILKRKIIFEYYSNQLNISENIQCMKINKNIKYNYAYFPVFFKNKNYRDKIYEKLKRNNIFCRKYWYPLINEHNINKNYRKDNLINSKKLSESVLCLPIYPSLKLSNAKKIVELVLS